MPPAKDPPIDQRIMKALSHPLRVRMLTLLNQKVSSPSELAEELDEPLGNVSYHMRFLADLNMVKLVRTEPRRGAVEHYYEALEPPLMSDEDWAEVPLALRRSLSDSTLSNIATDLKGAARAGGFDRNNIHLSRTELLLDQQGWDELSGLLADVLQRARGIQEQSNKRRNRPDGDGGIATALVLMQFEARRSSASGPKRSRGA
jgi:DNA-binding transcriptional ArsR family regulator